MKQLRRCMRISILPLLLSSVSIPIFLLSSRLKHLHSDASTGFAEDLSIIKHRTDAQKLSATEQDERIGLKEPSSLVYKDRNFGSAVSFNTSDTSNKESVSSSDGAKVSANRGTGQNTGKGGQRYQLEEVLPNYRGQEHSKQTTVGRDQVVQSHPQTATNRKLNEMKDQVVRARAYLSFFPSASTSHFVKELKLRIRELERAMSGSTRDSSLSRNALQKSKAMEATLSKANHIFPDCSAMAKKLRAMTYNAEEQVRTQKNQVLFLVQLAGRTTPKGLHCLSMRLTSEYFALRPEEQQLPNLHRLHNLDLYHYAVFSDNVLACAVVVNSTISNALEPERIVIHIITDSLNFPAISMWFLLNPPGKAIIEVQNMDSFGWSSTKYDTTSQMQNSHDPRYNSPLSHIRFYLPDVFPLLNKIVLLDHDVLVQRDLTGLWSINMQGKVNGAVQTCQEGEPSFRRMDMFINFSDPAVTKRFDAKECTWAFGMNFFDLREWRQQNLTGLYHEYLQLGNKRPVWKAGTLPLGWVTFYNRTVALDRRWHVPGLGYDSGVRLDDIEQAAVIHYDGISKPWLEIGPDKYKQYWKKYAPYDHPYLEQCNIHP